MTYEGGGKVGCTAKFGNPGCISVGLLNLEIPSRLGGNAPLILLFCIVAAHYL